jgi:hypothetical protein
VKEESAPGHIDHSYNLLVIFLFITPIAGIGIIIGLMAAMRARLGFGEEMIGLGRDNELFSSACIRAWPYMASRAAFQIGQETRRLFANAGSAFERSRPERVAGEPGSFRL